MQMEDQSPDSEDLKRLYHRAGTIMIYLLQAYRHPSGSAIRVQLWDELQVFVEICATGEADEAAGGGI
jgi:hypothetical protein